jgi:hypothetical protein
VGQFGCGSIPGWKTDGRRRILRLMDDPTIKLYPDKESGTWNWELLLKGKRIAHGQSPDTQESAYTAARQALTGERERRSKRWLPATPRTPNQIAKSPGQNVGQLLVGNLFQPPSRWWVRCWSH